MWLSIPLEEATPPVRWLSHSIGVGFRWNWTSDTWKRLRCGLRPSMSDAAEIAPVLAAAFGEAKWPPPFAKQSGDLAALHDAVVRELEAGPMELDKTALLLGSLVLGQAAEYVFEDIYK